MPRGTAEFNQMQGFLSDFSQKGIDSDNIQWSDVECKELDDSMTVDKGLASKLIKPTAQSLRDRRKTAQLTREAAERRAGSAASAKMSELRRKAQLQGKGFDLDTKASDSHPGFKAVQDKIAAQQGVSKKRAGAILAASSRKASAAAKAKNPNLKKVKG